MTISFTTVPLSIIWQKNFKLYRLKESNLSLHWREDHCQDINGSFDIKIVSGFFPIRLLLLLPPSVTPTLHFDSLDVLEEMKNVTASRGVIEYLLQLAYIILHTASDEIKKRKDYARPSLFDLNASNYIFLTLHDVNYHIWGQLLYPPKIGIFFIMLHLLHFTKNEKMKM